MLKTLEALGPEDESFPVKGELKALPIVVKALKSNNTRRGLQKGTCWKSCGRGSKWGQKPVFREAILNVYSKLAESLIDNQPYS